MIKFIKKHEKMWYIIFCWKNLKKCLKRLHFIILYYKIKKNIKLRVIKVDANIQTTEEISIIEIKDNIKSVII